MNQGTLKTCNHRVSIKKTKFNIMKKLFFTALVAVVAIGGAFAGSANGVLTVTEYGTNPSAACPINQPPIDCSPSGLIPCESGEDQLYTTDGDTGLCSIQLFED